MKRLWNRITAALAAAAFAEEGEAKAARQLAQDRLPRRRD